MDGLDSPLAASSELAQSSAPFAWIADRLSHKTPADNAQVYDPEDMLPLADRAPASAAVQHLQQGHAYGYRGDLIQALLEFDLAIEANPNDPEAHLWRAVTLERLGDHRQALSDLRQAQDLNGAGSEILVEYGNVYSALSQWQLAIAQYDLALELSPQHVQAHHNRGVAYERLGQSTIARTCYEQAIALSPKTPEPHLGLAVACELMSDWAQAVASYQTVIETAGQGTLADQARERLQVLSNPA